MLTSNLFAAPAICGKYSAELANGKGKISISSYGVDWDNKAGYTDKQATISGSVSKTCEVLYEGGASVCGVSVKNVKLLKSDDCWD